MHNDDQPSADRNLVSTEVRKKRLDVLREKQDCDNKKVSKMRCVCVLKKKFKLAEKIQLQLSKKNGSKNFSVALTFKQKKGERQKIGVNLYATVDQLKKSEQLRI